MAEKDPPKNVLKLIADALARKQAKPKAPRTGWRSNVDGSLRQTGGKD
jgi:hypothetical protein